jgi:FAD/FMN-containing dehydrogenase
MKLAGWGNYPRLEVEAARFRDDADAVAAVAARKSLIARGNGRAYGDAALNPRGTVSSLRHDRIFAFEPATGRLTCEAGTMLADILRAFVPRGWFVPVTPGTKFVTVGGMIAADVHGKNHHVAGSIGRHVESMRLLCGDGAIRDCGRDNDPDLFRATLGGMGLTGIILDATIRLVPVETAWIRQETRACRNLDEVLAASEETKGFTYSAAWIDCLERGASRGRSLLYLGQHAEPGDLPARARTAPLNWAKRTDLRVPFFLPGATLNGITVKLFNVAYFRTGARRAGTARIDAERFFYPLDAVRDWNRIYGRRGFVQYQCVLPKAASREGLTLLLDRIANAGEGSFLAVLKLMGPADTDGGLLSFPMEGYTLALDFPARPRVFELLNTLDSIVADHGGRLYLAKDARMSADMMRRTYPNLAHFQEIRAATGSSGKFTSAMAERLGL